MPGRTGGQFGALEQQHVGAARLGQVIGDGAAKDAAADNDDTGMGLHEGKPPGTN